MNQFCTVPPRWSHSTRTSFRGLFGGSLHRNVALPPEVLECRGQGRPRLFPLTLRTFPIRPRPAPSSAWARALIERGLDHKFLGSDHKFPGPTKTILKFMVLFLFFLKWQKKNLSYEFKLKLWGRGVYDSTHALLGPRARAEDDICGGRMGKGRSVEWNSRGWPCPRHSRTSRGRVMSRWWLPPKSPLKEMRVEWDPRGGTMRNWFKVNTKGPRKMAKNQSLPAHLLEKDS